MIYTFKNIYGATTTEISKISVSPNIPIITTVQDRFLNLHLPGEIKQLMFKSEKDAEIAQIDIDLYSNYTRELNPEKFL